MTASLLLQVQTSVACAMMPDMPDMPPDMVDCCCTLQSRPSNDNNNEPSDPALAAANSNPARGDEVDPHGACCTLQFSVKLESSIDSDRDDPGSTALFKSQQLDKKPDKQPVFLYPTLFDSPALSLNELQTNPPAVLSPFIAVSPLYKITERYRL